METRMTAVQANNLTIGYQEKKRKKVVQSNIHLTLYSGEVTCLLGLNGAGKSTLLRLLAGVYTPDAGKINQKKSTVLW